MIWAGSNTLGSSLLGIAPLTPVQQIICWSIGSTSLLVNIVCKQIPVSVFKFAANIDLETENKNEFINKVTNQATNKIKSKVGQLAGGKESTIEQTVGAEI